jgi:hypothetical protein
MACEEGKWLHNEFRKAALARIEGADAKPAPFIAELKAKEAAARILLANHIRDCPECSNSNLLEAFSPRRSQIEMPFRHRQNSEKSFDSICTICAQTVGKRETEAELKQDEKAHVCNGRPPLFEFPSIS